MDITVNCAETVGPLRHFWQSTGFTPANLLLNADMQQALAYLGAAPHGGITWVRIHYLLELVKADGLGTDAPTHDWSRLDPGLDVLVSNSLKPIFELMGNVEGWFGDYTDPAQAHAWRVLVGELARHLIDRYGADEVRGWLFETWNEPDIGFWKQSVDAFIAYYDACCAGLGDADPALRIGGPGTCRDLSETLTAFLAHCDGGTNTLTGEPATRPAFISVHAKGVRSHVEDLTPNTMQIVGREAAIIQYIRDRHPSLASIPFSNNECDPQVGWGTIHTWRGRPYYAALAAKIINQHLMELVDRMEVDYAILSNDNGFLGAWGHRTLLARFGDYGGIDHGQATGMRDAPRFEEDPRRRRFELIKQPILTVMTLLALLGDTRCAVDGAPDVSEPLGAIGTRRGDDQIAVLLYNSQDKITAGGATTVTLELRDLPFAQASLVYYRIDEGHGDPFSAWEAMDAPDHPSQDQLAELRSIQELPMMGRPHNVSIQDGRMTIRFEQPLPGVTLILLSRRPPMLPPQVTGLRATPYEGTTDADQLLLAWDDLGCRTLRTYEVQCAPSEDGPYARINTQDQLDTAFLHVRDSGPGFYRVRAVDYWDGHGEWSKEISR